MQIVAKMRSDLIIRGWVGCSTRVNSIVHRCTSLRRHSSHCPLRKALMPPFRKCKGNRDVTTGNPSRPVAYVLITNSWVFPDRAAGAIRKRSCSRVCLFCNRAVRCSVISTMRRISLTSWYERRYMGSCLIAFDSHLSSAYSQSCHVPSRQRP